MAIFGATSEFDFHNDFLFLSPGVRGEVVWITSLGFQGRADFDAISVAHPTDADIERAFNRSFTLVDCGAFICQV